jgi:CrcB protein
MFRLFLIFVGGGCGSVLRYAVAGWVQRFAGSTFPWGTFVANVLGCTALGFLASLFMGPFLIREDYRLAILVGLLGGFTTFSSYGWETLTLAGDGQWWLASANVVLSNGCGLAAAWLGIRLAGAIYGA